MPFENRIITRLLSVAVYLRSCERRVKDETRQIRAESTRIAEFAMARALALASFEPAIRLVDDVSTAAPTDHAAIAVARLERLQAVADLHGARLSLRLVWSKIRKAAQKGSRWPRA
jgi:hypothetical protein